MIRIAAAICGRLGKNTVRKKNSNTGNPGAERRRWPRLKASSVPFLKGVVLGQGNEVHAIDISRGGMLLESEVRLPPQMKLHLKLVTSDGVIKMEGSVLRSSIISLAGVPRYRSAIVFDHPFHMLDDLSPEPEPASESRTELDTASAPPPDNSLRQPIADDSGSEILELKFFATELPESSIWDILKQNDW
jgi:hypothetical protein